jgi:death-on-curing protein
LRDPVWVELEAVLRFHDESIMAFGGVPGIRDSGAVESALARPQNFYAYRQPRPDIFELAAAYTLALCQNHGFIDGNKRTAFLTGAMFLARNGYAVEAEQAEVVAAMLELAEHKLEEEGYARWLRDVSRASEAGAAESRQAP